MKVGNVLVSLIRESPTVKCLYAFSSIFNNLKMNGILSLLVMCFAVTHSLFMNSANSSYLTAHDFRQLLDLLMEEKHLRGQLENRVNQLEQELHTNEGKVDAFNQAITKEKSNRHQLETAYTRLLMSFHNLSSDDNALRADHAKEIARNNELEKRFLNLTKDAMEKFKLHEHEIKNILNKTLDQGLSNKTKIMIRAINQSVRNNVSNINKRVITLEATISSIAANMTRNHRVITTIEAENMDIRSNLSKCQAILIRNKAEIALLGANFSSLHGGVFTINSSVLKSVALTFSNQLEGRIAANEAKISTIQGNVTQNLASIAAHGRTLSSLNTDIQQLKQKAGKNYPVH